jgi:hypothetical protein
MRSNYRGNKRKIEETRKKRQEEKRAKRLNRASTDVPQQTEPQTDTPQAPLPEHAA